MPADEHVPHEHRPRDSPHEKPLRRGELDEERWFEEEGAEMAERLGALDRGIHDTERHVHEPVEDGLSDALETPRTEPDEIAGGHTGRPPLTDD